MKNPRPGAWCLLGLALLIASGACDHGTSEGRGSGEIGGRVDPEDASITELP